MYTCTIVTCCRDLINMSNTATSSNLELSLDIGRKADKEILYNSNSARVFFFVIFAALQYNLSPQVSLLSHQVCALSKKSNSHGHQPEPWESPKETASCSPLL